MQYITDDYKTLNEKLHASNPAYGTSGKRYVDEVLDMAARLGTTDILDYGCGKSTLAHQLPFPIHQYDPAIPKHSKLPDPADLVVCTDVMEHIEPENLDNVINHIKSLTKKAAFITVATRPAVKFLADGRNAHLIQENGLWWFNKFANAGFFIRSYNDKGGEVYFKMEPAGYGKS